MKRIILIAFTLSIAFYSISQTVVPAGNVNGTWSLSGSPYEVTGDISIADGETLTIEPGVEVIFQGHFGLDINGQILAIGNAEQTILFTINDNTGWNNLSFNIGTWKGVEMSDVSMSNDTSRFDFCILEYAKEVEIDGGAMHIDNVNKLIVSNSLIRFCNGEQDGGAIFLKNSNGVIYRNNYITENYGFDKGGAMYIENSDNITIENNTIFDNNTEAYAGGLYLLNCDNIMLKSNIITNNGGFNEGAGVYDMNCNSTYVNNIIVNNFSGGIFFKSLGNTVRLYNNTIAYNNHSAGGVFIYEADDMMFYNNIIWGNTSNSSDLIQIHCAPDSRAEFFYCNIEGGFEGFSTIPGWTYPGDYASAHNIDIDPQFVNPCSYCNGLLANWFIAPTSPCVDAGDPNTTIEDTDELDFAGNPRFVENSIDIGAYESQGPLLIGKTNSNIDVTIFPNPTNGQINISAEDIVKIELVNIHGQILYSGKEADLDLSTLTNGIYFIKIVIGSETITRKILKQ